MLPVGYHIHRVRLYQGAPSCVSSMKIMCDTQKKKNRKKLDSPIIGRDREVRDFPEREYHFRSGHDKQSSPHPSQLITGLSWDTMVA